MRNRLIGSVSATEAADDGEDQIASFDLTEPKWTQGHIDLREDCVKHFEIAFKANQVEWLKYPSAGV
jgi:hypothetical protein